MTRESIEQRMRQANPVMAGSGTPTNVVSPSALLIELDRRSGDTQTQEELDVRLAQTPRPKRQRRFGPVLAAGAAVFAAVLLAVALGGDDRAVSQYAEAAAAGEAEAVLGHFVESYRIGDVEQALAYVGPDIRWNGNVAADAAALIPGIIEFEGALHGRDAAGPSVCEGPDLAGWVACTFSESGDSVSAAAGFPETSWRARVAGGRIVTLQGPGRVEGGVFRSYVGSEVERPLGVYAEEIDPEGMAAQCDWAGSVLTGELVYPPVAYNKECGEFLAGFVDAYVASLGR